VSRSAESPSSGYAGLMLRNFLYLDTIALDGYLSALEDGLRLSSESEQSNSRDGSLGADAKVISARAALSAEQTRRTTGQDTPEARFARLLDIAAKDPEPLAWVDVLDPSTDLDNVGYGAMICGEAEFYTPHMVELLVSGELARSLDLIDRMEPLADVLDLDKQGLPDKRQRDAARSMVGALGTDVVIVGEFDESDWNVAGQCVSAYTRGRVEGPARFVGKVAKQWPAGEGRHLLALPGTTLLPRHQRRALERRRPDNPDDDSFLIGPALMLDLLAVWR
jgi:hypothetical protein